MERSGPADPAKKRSDNNRSRTISAVRKLQTLLAMACGPDFSGEIAIVVNSRGGYLGRHKATVTCWEPDQSAEDSDGRTQE